MRVIFLVLCTCVVFYGPLQAQKKSLLRDLEIGDAYFSIGEYNNALHYFLHAAKSNPSNTHALQGLAECYRLTGEYQNAENTYRQLLGTGNSDGKDSLTYALILRYNEHYEEAKLLYKDYAFSHSIEINQILHFIVSCDSALLWKNREMLNVEVINLGLLNSSYSEIAPTFYKEGIVFCSSKEMVLIRKKEGASGDPFYDLYFSRTNQNEQWENPKLFSSDLNTTDHEGPSSFNAANTEIFLTRVEARQKNDSVGGINYPKLYKSSKTILGWSKPEHFLLNDSAYFSAHPFISESGKFFFFASNLPGGYGGSDLYVSFKIDSLRWSKPINLGPSVNTEGNELYPFFVEAEGRIYFASNFHPGMGGFDIFTAELDGKDWINVSNLKPPINSSCDDFSFICSKKLKKGYFSSNRPGGKGKEDLYQVLFK